VNNGLLAAEDYEAVIRKAWKYLSTTALQRDGSIGYVQPIGEKAIPRQVVDQHSEANFGTGAWLLAACEYVRFIEGQQDVSTTGKQTGDRDYWVSLLVEISEPVLSNMARGELQKNMRVEVSPTWDGRDKRVTYMECFGRLMAGIAPWLALPDDNSNEGKKRKQLREWAMKSYENAVDPDSPDYLCWGVAGQNLVDAAYIAESFLRAWDTLWKPLP
jgi:hypothetical protein